MCRTYVETTVSIITVAQVTVLFVEQNLGINRVRFKPVLPILADRMVKNDRPNSLNTFGLRDKEASLFSDGTAAGQ